MMTRRLSKEEIDYLSSLKNVNRSAVEGVFSNPGYEEESYEYNLSNADLDRSLFRWNPETFDAIKRGFDACYDRVNIKIKEKI